MIEAVFSSAWGCHVDQIELDLTQHEAGASYLRALEALGLQSDALFWAYDKAESRFILVLVTEMFDFKGPLVVSELLFKAHNASMTPREIDPFVVRLHSPEHALIRQLDGWKTSAQEVSHQTGQPPAETIAIDNVVLSDLDFRPALIYRFHLSPKQKPADLIKRWGKIEKTIGQIAA